MTAVVELMDFPEVVERYDPVLGLEVHVELNTSTKMFCGCPNSSVASRTPTSVRRVSACPAPCLS